MGKDDYLSFGSELESLLYGDEWNGFVKGMSVLTDLTAWEEVHESMRQAELTTGKSCEMKEAFLMNAVWSYPACTFVTDDVMEHYISNGECPPSQADILPDWYNSYTYDETTKDFSFNPQCKE